MQFEINSVASMQRAFEAVNYFHDSLFERFDILWNGENLNFHYSVMPTQMMIECLLISGHPANPTNLQTVPVRCQFFAVTRLLCDFEDIQPCDWSISSFDCTASHDHEQGEFASLFALEISMSYFDKGEWTRKRRISFLFRTATFTVYDQEHDTEAEDS